VQYKTFTAIIILQYGAKISLDSMAWMERFQQKNHYHVENINNFLEDGVRATIVSSGNRVVWLLLFEGEINYRNQFSS
jgi:hypothetical protein